MRVRSVSREEAWASAGVQGAWVGGCGPLCCGAPPQGLCNAPHDSASSRPWLYFLWCHRTRTRTRTEGNTRWHMAQSLNSNSNRRQPQMANGTKTESQCQCGAASAEAAGGGSATTCMYYDSKLATHSAFERPKPPAPHSRGCWRSAHDPRLFIPVPVAARGKAHLKCRLTGHREAHKWHSAIWYMVLGADKGSVREVASRGAICLCRPEPRCFLLASFI